jgi:outer membrane protein TolC
VNEFLNYILPEDFATAEDFSFTPLPEIEKRIDQLIETSPLIRLKLNQVKRETAHHKAAGFSIIEEIELFGEQEQEFEGKKWKVGIGISIPVFNWKSAHIKKAKLQKQKARIEYEHERKHFYADIQRMIGEIRVLEKEIETFKGAVLKEGRENMDLSETLYKEGEVSLVVFLDSQTSFFEIQERYYEAITQWNILKAELQELIGEEI